MTASSVERAMGFIAIVHTLDSVRSIPTLGLPGQRHVHPVKPAQTVG